MNGTGIVLLGVGVIAASAGIGGYAGYKLSDKKNRAIGTSAGAVAGALVLPAILFPLALFPVAAMAAPSR